jgi:hypothetical protein
VLAAASAVAQSSGSIEIVDMMAPCERRRVTPDWAAINAQPLGSKDNPVRTYQPAGEYAYLRDLLCADGLRPFYRRVGNAGLGPTATDGRFDEAVPKYAPYGPQKLEPEWIFVRT